MSGTVKTGLKTVTVMAAAAFAMLAACAIVSAVGTAQIMKKELVPPVDPPKTEIERQDSILLYVRGTGDTDVTSAKVDNSDTKAAVNWDAFPVATWILYDNSQSMQYQKRKWREAENLLTVLTANRAPEEDFYFCTYSDRLEVRLRKSRIFTELDSAIDQVKGNYVDQKSYLMNALNQLLDEPELYRSGVYSRIIIISDGGDSGVPGATVDTINSRLAEQTIPIYTVSVGANNQPEQAMEMLPGYSNGQCWDLENAEPRIIASDLRWAELPKQVRVVLPQEAFDGYSHTVQVTFANNTSAVTEEMIPKKNVPDNFNIDPDPKPGGFPWWIVLASVFVLCGIGGAVWFFVVRRRRKEDQKFIPAAGGSVSRNSGSDKTDVMQTGEVDDGSTALLVNAESNLMLALVDLDNPGNHFESPLRGRVSIGRNASNQIVIDYDKSVSGQHCEIYYDGDNLFKVRDLNSTNGTFVNGIRVPDTADIMNGSEIRLGAVRFEVRIR